MYKDGYTALSPEEATSSTVFLDEVLKKHNINLSDTSRQISLQWKNIAGVSVASVSTCTGVKDGVLFVECSNASEAGLVRLNKSEILKNIRAVFPELSVSKINIRVRQLDQKL